MRDIIPAEFPGKGQYAVYVSYPTHKKSVPDAQYIVYHQGRKTVFYVNQQMGGGTWVYLGTFDFDSGCNSGNRVVLTNESAYNGFVTADAVRFGGGMGNVKRNNIISGLPRCLEGARYYAQWAGAPDSVYRSKMVKTIIRKIYTPGRSWQIGLREVLVSPLQ